MTSKSSRKRTAAHFSKLAPRHNTLQLLPGPGLLIISWVRERHQPPAGPCAGSSIPPQPLYAGQSAFAPLPISANSSLSTLSAIQSIQYLDRPRHDRDQVQYDAETTIVLLSTLGGMPLFHIEHSSEMTPNRLTLISKTPVLSRLCMYSLWKRLNDSPPTLVALSPRHKWHP